MSLRMSTSQFFTPFETHRRQRVEAAFKIRYDTRRQIDRCDECQRPDLSRAATPVPKG